MMSRTITSYGFSVASHWPVTPSWATSTTKPSLVRPLRIVSARAFSSSTSRTRIVDPFHSLGHRLQLRSTTAAQPRHRSPRVGVLGPALVATVAQQPQCRERDRKDQHSEDPPGEHVGEPVVAEVDAAGPDRDGRRGPAHEGDGASAPTPREPV